MHRLINKRVKHQAAFLYSQAYHWTLVLTDVLIAIYL